MNNNINAGSDMWSFFGRQTGHSNSSRSTEPTTGNNGNVPPMTCGGSSTIVLQIPPPKQPRSTPGARGGRKGRASRPQQHRHRILLDQRQCRSRSVKGAANLSKETRLLRNKLDRLLETFQETVVVAAQSQTTQLESLRAENHQLKVQLDELETETLKQYSELADCEEVIVATEKRRLTSDQEASKWKSKYEELAKEVELLKESAEKRASTSEVPAWKIETKKLASENKALRKELSVKAASVFDLKQELRNAKLKLLGDKENNANGVAETNAGLDDDNPSLIAARGIFGHEIPSSFLNTDQQPRRIRDAGPGTKKIIRRKSVHGMTLRGYRQTNSKHEF